jgi:hypothetical protein
MKQFEFNVYIETLTIWAKDEAEAEKQYAAYYEDGECILHQTHFSECHCLEHDDTVGHVMTEVA